MELNEKNDAQQAGQYQQEEESSFNFQTLYTMFILNWEWFALSLIICLGLGFLYLRYKSPTYEVSAKILIKDEQSPNRGGSNQILANMQDLGFISNSYGIDNEVEILMSRALAEDVVKDLNLYVQYKSKGRIKNTLIYKHQPINVSIDPVWLAKIEQDVDDYGTDESAQPVELEISKTDDGYYVEGSVYVPSDNSEDPEMDVYPFYCDFKTLPVAIITKAGTLTLTENIGTNLLQLEEKNLLVTITPPSLMAQGYVNNMTVEPTSKMTSIALITLDDKDPKRAEDFLNQLAVSYNRQANADKNEIALKTEEFINGRVQKIDAELGSTDDALEGYKKRNRLTELNLDATQTLQQSTEYSSKLAESGAQIELLDYLREYVDNPENQYQIIPSNVGLQDQASTQLITQFNQNVLDRNRMLRSASELSPQVQALTVTLDQLQSSIKTALMQARRAADIQRQSIKQQYSIYQGRVTSTPEQERILTQIGREQEVKSGLYLMLLEKREENSISLAATADKGKMIDYPQFEGKVSPKGIIVLLLALVCGVGIPFGILWLKQMMKYKIEGHDDVESMTKLPIVADVPVASESVKTAAGIVVHENQNDQIAEIFRSLRTNIQFMLKGEDKVILFTSSMSGEGKTFNAANLAVSFALLGKKVVLVGLDIRKPALGRLFDTNDKIRGVTQLLTKDKVTEADVERQTMESGVNDNLDLLLAGVTPPNPTELLARETLKEIIDILRNKYDYVILDTAPVGLVTDTLQVGKYADVSVYICRADYTPKANFGAINQLAEEGKLKNVCVVLNGVDMSKKENSYYYGYGKYGKYGRYGSYGRYGRYGSYGRYGKYGSYGRYGTYGSYGNYSSSHYGNKEDNSIKK